MVRFWVDIGYRVKDRSGGAWSCLEALDLGDGSAIDLEALGAVWRRLELSGGLDLGDGSAIDLEALGGQKTEKPGTGPGFGVSRVLGQADHVAATRATRADATRAAIIVQPSTARRWPVRASRRRASTN